MRIPVAVVGQRVQPVTAWGVARWFPRAVLPEMPEAPAGAALGDGLVLLGEAAVEFHRVETANYRDNLATLAPRLWVVLREAAGSGAGLPEIVAVTADPAEGEGFTEAGIDLAERVVETVPMPAPIAALLARFVAENHVEREFFKRRRDRAR